MNIIKAKFLAARAIDLAAGEVRERYITDVAGQQAVYLEKRTEAALYVTAHSLNSATAVPGPHLVSEATETSASPLVVANEILAAAASWLNVLSPAIEGKRVGGKARVRAASTVDDVEAERVAAVAAIQALFAT